MWEDLHQAIEWFREPENSDKLVDRLIERAKKLGENIARKAAELSEGGK